MDPCLRHYIKISNREPSPLASVVFTQKNVNDLQSVIQKEVYEKTNGIRITKQTDEALLSIMYNTYLFLVHKSSGQNSHTPLKLIPKRFSESSHLNTSTNLFFSRARLAKVAL